MLSPFLRNMTKLEDSLGEILILRELEHGIVMLRLLEGSRCSMCFLHLIFSYMSNSRHISDQSLFKIYNQLITSIFIRFLIGFAGHPTTTIHGETSFVTKEHEPTTAPSPIVTSG